jgi:four helix bundle protein
VGSNYIEANESLSKKILYIESEVCKKEAKERIYWLNLLEIHDTTILEKERLYLIQDATELMKILASIIYKSE